MQCQWFEGVFVHGYLFFIICDAGIEAGVADPKGICLHNGEAEIGVFIVRYYRWVNPDQCVNFLVARILCLSMFIINEYMDNFTCDLTVSKPLVKSPSGR
ncbi:MAG TPA: hypothetical protein DDY37_06055 [Legionella sp.]|nr:hypothetical protein [Legionella sp.]